MQDGLREKIEQVLDRKVRPVLHEHDGEIQLLHFKDGVLSVRMTGQCGGCPAAAFENEALIQKEICMAVPEVHRVFLDTGVSDSLIEEAHSLLYHRNQQNQQ